MLWLIWIVIALIAAVVEIVGSGLVFLGVAGAAVVAAIVAAIFGSSTLVAVGSAAAFAAVAVFYLLALRPPVLRLISGQSQGGFLGSHHGASGIVGRRAIVTQTVSSDGGQIRIGQGEFWSARPFNPDETLPEGARVEVLLRDGLTALVAAADEHQTAV